MNKEQLLYSQMLMAVAQCEQSDGYLKTWAREKMAKAADKQLNGRGNGKPLKQK